MKTINRTIYGARLQTQLLLGLPYTHIPNTTLNEKFDVSAGVLQDNPTTNIPKIGYFGIGVAGHRVLSGAGGVALPDEVPHSPRDAALYGHIPFVLRAPTNDLSASERGRYAMRKEIEAAGQSWIAYYLKRLQMASVTTQLMHNRVVNGVTTSTPFVPDSSVLNPIHPVMPNTGVVTTSGDFLSVSTIVRLDFTAADSAELLNVAQILYGDSRYARISEIALVAGCDKNVQATTSGGTPFNYVEAVQAQVAAFVSAEYSADYNNDGFRLALNVGASEQLLTTSTGN